MRTGLTELSNEAKRSFLEPRLLRSCEIKKKRCVLNLFTETKRIKFIRILIDQNNLDRSIDQKGESAQQMARHSKKLIRLTRHDSPTNSL